MFSGHWVWKDLNKGKNVNLKKNSTFCQKNAKIRNGKMLKPLHCHKKLRSNLFLKPKEGSSTPRADKGARWGGNSAVGGQKGGLQWGRLQPRELLFTP